jgi:hypothetical protein
MAMVMFQFFGSAFIAIAITCIILMFLRKTHNVALTKTEMQVGIIGGFVLGAICIMNSFSVNNQLAFYQKKLMDASNDKIRFTLQCKIAGYEDLDRCPMYYEIVMKENEYKHKLDDLMKKKYSK